MEWRILHQDSGLTLWSDLLKRDKAKCHKNHPNIRIKKDCFTINTVHMPIRPSIRIPTIYSRMENGRITDIIVGQYQSAVSNMLIKNKGIVLIRTCLYYFVTYLRFT